jgi:CheY-like chemotaxis protein
MTARILVINDAQELQSLFCDVLEGEGGYEVAFFSYAPQEIAEIEAIHPDLIILDLIFGRENLGWQLLQKLKLRRSTAKIPVVICTAATQAVREIEGYLQANRIVVVAKPFNIDDLLLAVKQGLAATRRSIRPPLQEDTSDDED